MGRRDRGRPALAPLGALPWAMALSTATAWITVVQRILSVRSQLRARVARGAGQVRPLHRTRTQGRHSCRPRFEETSPVLALWLAKSRSSERTSVLVRMPPAIKAPRARGRASRLEPERRRRRALAERHGVQFSGSGRRRRVAFGAAGRGCTPHAAKLRAALKDAAREQGRNVNDLVLATLADSLAILFVSNRKDSMASTNGSTNGRARSEDKVRVAVIGVGNCANSLLQGVHYYQDADPDQFVRPRRCTSTSAAITSETSSSRPPSTSPRTRSGRIWPTRSGRT